MLFLSNLQNPSAGRGGFNSWGRGVGEGYQIPFSTTKLFVNPPDSTGLHHIDERRMTNVKGTK
jgi:hypothetical protein